jgi:hypothetical protein
LSSIFSDIVLPAYLAGILPPHVTFHFNFTANSVHVNAFAAASFVVAGTAASGILLIAFEIVQTRRSEARSGNQDNA